MLHFKSLNKVTILDLPFFWSSALNRESIFYVFKNACCNVNACLWRIKKLKGISSS